MPRSPQSRNIYPMEFHDKNVLQVDMLTPSIAEDQILKSKVSKVSQRSLKSKTTPKPSKSLKKMKTTVGLE